MRRASEDLALSQPERLPAPAESAAIVKVEQVTPPPTPSTLSNWQRQAMDARCVILNLVDDLAKAKSLRRAVKKVATMARQGTLPAHIQDLVTVANARSGGEEKLSESTLFSWRRMRRESGTAALAPKDQRPQVPDWAECFLKLYRQPQKPSVNDVLERLPEILPEGMAMPSQMQCYRLLSKMSAVDREKGRRTGNELRSIMPFRRRSTDDLMPLDIVTCDGHTFKAKVAHPFHGKPFQPEVCAVVDVATRKAIGWSAGLSESSSTVADALRHSIQQAGIPAMLYTDPGSGNTANVNAHESYGRYARLGITFTTGLPGRTQARGLIERFQQSCWIKSAKLLPTYSAKDMDGTTLYKMTRLIDSEIRKTGSSDKIMPWNTFLQFLDACAITAYNNRPHSELPKITDAAGRKRHMTPNECWEVWIRNGWQPERISEEELADMWRPRILRKTLRGEVRLFGNIYAHSDLQHYHESQVWAEYEPQDATFLYVRDLDCRLICKAKWNGNRSGYQPVSAVEIARDKRADNRLALVEKKREEIELERRGGMVIDIQPDPELIETRRQLEETMRLELAESNEPEFTEDTKGNWLKWKWLDGLMKEIGSIPEKHEAFYRAFMTSSEWKAFSDVERDLGGNDERRDEKSAERV